MKKVISFIGLVFFILDIFSQSPDMFKYQAIIRNSNGEIVSGQNVSIDISILQGSTTGSEVYTETHDSTTNQFGMVTLNIGAGNQTGFGSIDWSTGPYFLKLELDGELLGITQLLSVPFAKYADNAGNVFSGNYDELTNKPDLNNYLTTESDPVFSNSLAASITGEDTIRWSTSSTFSGDFGDLLNVPAGLSDGDDDTQLTEGEVDTYVANNGYLTSEVDGSITNEIELPTQTGNSGKYLTTDGTDPSWATVSAGASQLNELSDVNTSTVTSGNILVADGTDFESVSVSGDATLASNGDLTIADNSVDGTDIALGSDAAGDVMYYDGTNWVRLAKGTNGQVLTLSSGVPAWADASGSGGVDSDESGLKIIRGEVSSSGTKLYGSGFSSSGSGGAYTITFSSAFSGMPTVVATLKANDHYSSIEVKTISTSGCDINTIETYNELLHAEGFTFIAIGPK